jgi:hypothetical protein
MAKGQAVTFVMLETSETTVCYAVRGLASTISHVIDPPFDQQQWPKDQIVYYT